MLGLWVHPSRETIRCPVAAMDTTRRMSEIAQGTTILLILKKN
jgi:TusA-related sulfurtransferase